MDPESLKRQKIKEREQLRQEILKELKQDYYLTPKTKKLEITDIFEKYEQELLTIGRNKSNGTLYVGRNYSQMEAIKQAFRKVVCMHFGVGQLKDIPKEKYNEYREELEKLITEYCNIERKD